MESIQVNNYDFHYVEEGEGNPVILVHGSISDYRTWEYQIKPFANQFHVYALCRRYHYPWNSDEEISDYSVPLHARDLSAFIDALDLESVNFVGSSYGAYSSLIAAMENPEIVQTLVLCEPPIIPLLVSNMNNPLHIASLLLRDFSTGKSFVKFGAKAVSPAKKKLRNGEYEEAVRLFTDGVLGEGEFDQQPKDAQKSFIDNAPALKAELLGPGFPELKKEKITHLNIPTLLVNGENSPTFFGTISDKLHDLIPESEKVVIPEVSHNMHAAKPEIFNETVLDFLNRCNS